WAAVARFASNMGVLHNPDQVAGGYDRFPSRDDMRPPGPAIQNTQAWRDYYERLFRCVGLSVVNSAIGGQWDRVLGDAPVRIQASVPAVSQFINRLNFRLLRRIHV